MKTQRALILPVLLATLVVNQLEVRAQPNLTPPRVAGTAVTSTLHDLEPSPGPSPNAAGSAPLGMPSALGAAPPEPMGFGKPGGPGKYANQPTSFGGSPGFSPGAMGGPGMGFAPGGMMPGPSPMSGPMGMPGPMGMSGPMPASFQDGPFPSMPADMAYGDAMMGPKMMTGQGMMMGGDEYCDPNQERGFDLLRYLLPYGEGGWSQARWFDVHAEFMYLTRRDVSQQSIPFTSDGPAGLGSPWIVLSSDDLSFDEAPGFRITAAWQLGASSNLEFSYFGTFNWKANASVSSPTDDLYSVLSDFGNNPPPQSDPIVVRGGFSDTDSAFFHGIDYSSSIDSYELDFRRRWIFPNGRLQGSWLMGARHVHLEEGLLHRTLVNYVVSANQPDPVIGSMDYLVNTDNALTGFQLGGDIWATIIPGFQIGMEGKAGIYGNRVKATTTVNADSLEDAFSEQLRNSRASFVGESGFMATWRLTQKLTLRGGYQMVYVDGVALAPDNFNTQPPFLQGAREPHLHNSSHVFYHGFTGGLEWMW